MFGSLDALFAATVLFVGGHFVLSSQPVREVAVKQLGAQGFTTVYSLAMTGAILWMTSAYAAAPLQIVWTPPPWAAWIPVVLNAAAFVFAFAGVTTRSPTMVGGDRRAMIGPEDPAPGILRVTRHPFLWGTTLWSLSHLCVNGDAASIVMFGGLLVLSLGGMWHIDQRRERAMGAAWGPIQLTTSRVPFAAMIAGRTHMDWKGLGIWRPTGGLALYVALVYLHPWLFGVPALPG
jgi:uncharacterized membrane protein